MEFRVLGPLEVVHSGRPVVLGGRKQRAVLALLLLHANDVVSSTALMEAVWGGSPPERARATLQVYVSNLRRLLETDGRDAQRPRLLQQPPGYVLRCSDHEVDLDRFRQLVADAHVAHEERDSMRASLLFRAALGLWRGPAFPDLGDGDRSVAEVAALEGQRLEALEYRLDADLEAGRAEQVVTELAALVGLHPLRERLHAQRMIALYRTGRQAEALAAYQAAVAVIREDLGVDPSPDLQELERAVLRQDPALDPVPRESLHPTLPVAGTELIGRERELAAITALLDDEPVRLVTLLGPGGTGKTRLGIELAKAAQATFVDGVFYVSLAALTDPLLVLPAIASTVDVRETAERPLHELLVDRLGDQRALLVLDNFEQLVPAAAHIAELIKGTRYLKILVTSRATLRISGEHEYPLDPLTPPQIDPLTLPQVDPQTLPIALLRGNPAVRLFVERAQAVAPQFDPTSQDVAAVAAICHRLDGLPLAIELAAARIRSLSPDEILTRLGARLQLLTGGPSDAPTQQQTMRGSIEWSYSLLEPAERELFAHLAVFRGGCTLDAVEAVCTPADGDALDLLDLVDSLVSQSLVQRRRASNGDIRFAMLQTIHGFAEELLDVMPGDSVRRRRDAFFVGLAEAAAPGLTGHRQLDWLTRLNIEHDNLRAALASSTASGGDTGNALRLAAALWHFWEMSGSFTEGLRWLETVLDGAGATDPALRLRVLSGAATLAWSVGDHDRATRLHEEALALARELGDGPAEAFGLTALGAQLVDRDCYNEAEELFERALELALKLGEPRTAGMARHNTAEIAFHRHEYALAAEGYEESLRIFGELDDRFLIVPPLHGLAVTMLRQGDPARAAAILCDSLTLAAQVGENYWLAEGLERMAMVAGESAQTARAVRLLGAADAMRRRLGAPLQAAHQSDYDSLVAIAQAKLGSDAFALEWESGQRLTTKEAVEEALRR